MSPHFDSTEKQIMQKFPIDSKTGDFSNQRPFSIILAIHGHSDPLPPFVHALCLTCATKGELEIVDVRKERINQSGVSVRKTFEKWRKLPAGSKREDVGKMGIRIKKTITKGSIKKEIRKRLRESYHDILIIGTETRKGISYLFDQDLAEYLAQSFRQTTLYVPLKAKPFADSETGQVSLKKILLPIAEETSPEPPFEMLQRILKFFPETSPDVIGVHLGEYFPYISGNFLKGLSWREITESPGNESISHLIARSAYNEKVDLIIMSTNGRDTLPEKIMGSVTENVVRMAPCPVLAVAVE